MNLSFASSTVKLTIQFNFRISGVTFNSFMLSVSSMSDNHMLIKFTVLMEMQNNVALRAFAGKNINGTQDKVHVIDSSNFP